MHKASLSRFRCLRYSALTFLASCISTHAAPLPVNLAPTGTATASSAAFGSSVIDGIDGNRNGIFPDGSVWHSDDPNPGSLPFYQVDLGVSKFLDRVELFPRIDFRQGTLRNFRITVFADNGGVPGAALFTQDYFTSGTHAADSGANRGWATRVNGVNGRFVKFEKLDATPVFATFAEMEIWGTDAPVPTNLALSATVTANEVPGFSSGLLGVNDDILNTDYAFNNGYIYHSTSPGVGRMLTLSLADVSTIDYLQLFARTDGPTTSNIRVKILDGANGVLSTQDVAIPDSSNGFDFQLDYDNLANAKFVTLETTESQFLAIGEVAIFGTAVPEPASASLLLLGGLAFLRRRRR